MSVLQVRFDFRKQELVFHLPSSELATKYQRKNQSGRILADKPLDVLIPVTSEMVNLRACKLGVVIRFKTIEAATDWRNRIVVGCLHPTRPVAKEVLLKREWNSNELETILR